MTTFTPTALCPAYAPLLGALGAAIGLSFSCFGAAYGTAKAGLGITAMVVMRPDRMMISLLPIVMAGVVGIYGAVVALFIANSIAQANYSLFTGAMQLGAGIAVGLCGIASGFAVGIVGDCGVRASVQQPRMFTGMMLILIFAEVLGLYGMIIGIMLLRQGGTSTCTGAFQAAA